MSKNFDDRTANCSGDFALPPQRGELAIGLEFCDVGSPLGSLVFLPSERSTKKKNTLHAFWAGHSPMPFWNCFEIKQMILIKSERPPQRECSLSYVLKYFRYARCGNGRPQSKR